MLPRSILLLSFLLPASATLAQSPTWEAPLRASLEKMATTLTEPDVRRKFMVSEDTSDISINAE